MLLLLVFSALSCTEEATVQVTNNVHNVRLDDISFKVAIGTAAYPGETIERKLRGGFGGEVSFPVRAQLEFYMVKGDKRAYLKTKEFFSVDDGGTLKIVLTDDTELVNPLNF